jgi:hypothetical protein
VTGLDVLRAVRRHPVVFIVCMLAAVSAAGAVWFGVPKNYSADSSLVLLSPEVITTGDGTHVRVNPWQQVGDNASQVTASALASVANSSEFQHQLAQSGATSTTAVAVSLTGGGVVLDVTAVNRDPAAASRDLRTTIEAVRSALLERQRAVGAPPSSLLRAVELTAPGDPTPMTGSRTKLAGVTGVLGLIIALVAVSLVEGRSRRSRRARLGASGRTTDGSRHTEDSWGDYPLIIRHASDEPEERPVAPGRSWDVEQSEGDAAQADRPASPRLGTRLTG